MKESMLNQFRLSMQEKKLGIYGVNVYQKGKGEISHQWRVSNRLNLYSASKTFTSLAIGICSDKRLLNISDSVLSFFPEYNSQAAENSEKITIRDLLHMSSGKKGFNFKIVNDAVRTEDWAKLFFLDEVVFKPGSEFFYSNSCSYMLSRVVEKVSGLKLRDFLIPHVFNPFGIFNPQWDSCTRGHSLGAAGLHLNTKEFSLLGVTLLNKGIYNDQRIISEEYIKLATTDVIYNAISEDDDGTKKFGYHLWLCSPEGAYRANGMYSRLCVVLPEKEAVVTVTAHEEHNKNGILLAIYQDIIPYLD